ncbi:MAG: aspartate--tRNA ligase [bacterium]|nr:aspartate--tRNA ligase [bacterium]
MERTYIKDLHNFIDKEVSISGWVDVRRDHGKLIFLDIRDMSGILQCVALPNHAETHKIASELRSEWVVTLTGKLNKRPEKMINKDSLTGDIELEVTDIKILNKSETPPFEITGDTRLINEDVRLQNRYIDLRSQRLQNNIRKRHSVMQFVRNYLQNEKFTEIETPMLTKSTPEGARDYLVPSRVEPGKFYALPQSPQQYKQLLMASGFEKYFQFAKCMRDEDTRGDRQPEFTQLDLEMSFVEQEDVVRLNEQLLIELIEKEYPEKKIQQKPFPRFTYKDSMEKYGTDRPDLRNDKNGQNLLAFCWIVDFPFFSAEGGPASGGENNGGWTFTHNPFSAPKPEYMKDLLENENIGGILTTQYDIVLNGLEIGGGSIRNHSADALRAVFHIMGFSDEKIETNFGHMLKAFKMGTPPHGGIAWGFDRLMMILQNEPNIREVIAFPKTGEGRDLMMDAPSEIDNKQLDELGLSIKKKA